MQAPTTIWSFSLNIGLYYFCTHRPLLRRNKEKAPWQHRHLDVVIRSIGALYRLALHLQAVFLPGIWAEGASFLREVVLDEADAAAAHPRILGHYTLHDGLHFGGLADVTLDIENIVLHSHADIRHGIANAFLPQSILIPEGPSVQQATGIP